MRRIEPQDLREMPDAELFITDFHAKNQASLDRHLIAFRAALVKETMEVGDFLRLAMKDVIEVAEVAALWFVDCDDLAMKIGFAEQCGSAAAHYRLISERIASLGAEAFDPRNGGYSRFFGFLRSLQTPEERAAAGLVTLRTFNMGRLTVFAELCEERGDADTAALFRDQIAADERRVFDIGWRILIANGATEESQARGRRAAFRIVELAAEAADPLQLRKALPKRRAAVPAPQVP
ncbi:MAG: hypothetical protein H7X95_01990 [Deltaproteobacteria bacterium]|nr:hypothetical protein [Deltaproteobacteria bacterium]